MRLVVACALAAALAGELPGGTGRIEVVATGEIKRLIDTLRGREGESLLPTPAGFLGELRPYQQRGYTWLSQTGSLGFGAVLADDMGLGKTIQVIAQLLEYRAAAGGTAPPALLVCPTSVLGNWERELRRFTPSL